MALDATRRTQNLLPDSMLEGPDGTPRNPGHTRPAPAVPNKAPSDAPGREADLQDEILDVTRTQSYSRREVNLLI